MKSEDDEPTREVKLPTSEDTKSIELPRPKRPKTDDIDPTALPGVGEVMGAMARSTGKGATAGSADGSSNASGGSSSRTRKRRRAAKRESGGQGGGRVRLPDKLLKYLKDEPVPGVVWWMPDGNGFAYDVDKVQTQFLDVHFRGTKLASFVRSLNRWGFRRVFYHALPENVNAFYHPKFKRDHPERVKEINMAPLPKSQGDEEEAEEETIPETGETLQEQQCPQVRPQAHQLQQLGQLQAAGQGQGGQFMAQQVQPAVTGDQQQAAIVAMLQGQFLSMMQQQAQQGQCPTVPQQPLGHVQQQQQAPQQGQAIWQLPQGLQLLSQLGLPQAHGQPPLLQRQQQQQQQHPQMGHQHPPEAHPNYQMPQSQHAQQQPSAQQFIILQPPQAARPPAQHLPEQQLQHPQMQLGGFGGQQGLNATNGQQLQAAIQHLVQQGLVQAMQQQQPLQQQAPQKEDEENKESG